MGVDLMPFIWVAVALPLLLLIQRWLHSHLHGLSLLIMGKTERAVILYAIILLPGVLLHELSHWLMAGLLGVRTGGFSLIPRAQRDGSVQLGYVEYYKDRSLGPLRESLIGGAPLIVGTAVILLISFRIFGITNLAAALQSGRVDALLLALTAVVQTNDFFVWLYLLFAISVAMMPSASDRRAWPAFLWTLLLVAIVVYLLDLTNLLLANLAQPLTILFGYLGTALTMAIGVSLLFMVLITILETILSRLRGVSVVYNSSGRKPTRF